MAANPTVLYPIKPNYGCGCPCKVGGCICSKNGCRYNTDSCHVCTMAVSGGYCVCVWTCTCSKCVYDRHNEHNGENGSKATREFVKSSSEGSITASRKEHVLDTDVHEDASYWKHKFIECTRMYNTHNETLITNQDALVRLNRSTSERLLRAVKDLVRHHEDSAQLGDMTDKILALERRAHERTRTDTTNAIETLHQTVAQLKYTVMQLRQQAIQSGPIQEKYEHKLMNQDTRTMNPGSITRNSPRPVLYGV